MAFMLLSPSDAMTLALASITLAGVGASVPAVADGILRRSRERYRNWLNDSLEDYCAFYRANGRAPCKRSSGRERALFEWAAELPRLAADGMLSKRELRSVAAADAPVPFSVTEDTLRRAPSERTVQEEFSVPASSGLVAAGAALVGLATALFYTAWGLDLRTVAGGLFVAACWLMAVVDARSRTIPSVCTAFVALSGTAFALCSEQSALTCAFVALGAWALLTVANLTSRKVRGENGVGGGDVRTMPFALGAVGPYGACAGMVAAAIALAAFLAVKSSGDRLSLQDKVPFGPFIAVAGIAGAASLALA